LIEVSVKMSCPAESPPPGGGLETVSAAVPGLVRSAAGTAAVSEPLFIKVVLRAVLFQRTLAPGAKLLPETDSVKAGVPLDRRAGERLLITGTGLSRVIVCGADVPPPGPGLDTVTEAVPGEVSLLAGATALSCVLLTNVLARLALFHRTVEELTKLLPFTVRVMALLPIPALVGLILLRTGVGLSIVKVWAADVPPPGVGVETVTEAVPALLRSLAGTTAVSCVLLTYVVDRAAPFQFTVELLRKFVPVTVSGKASLPARALVGLILLRTGFGLLIVKVWAADVPPPGLGLKAVTEAVPGLVRSPAGTVALS